MPLLEKEGLFYFLLTNSIFYTKMMSPEITIVTSNKKGVKIMRRIMFFFCTVPLLVILTGCITDPDVEVTPEGYYQFDVGAFTFFYNPNRCCAIEGVEYCGYEFNLRPYEMAIYCPRGGSSIVEVLLYDYDWEYRRPKIVGFGGPGIGKYIEVYPQGGQLRFRICIDGCWSEYEYRTLK